MSQRRINKKKSQVILPPAFEENAACPDCMASDLTREQLDELKSRTEVELALALLQHYSDTGSIDDSGFVKIRLEDTCAAEVRGFNMALNHIDRAITLQESGYSGSGKHENPKGEET